MNISAPTIAVGLETLQRETFDYFLNEANAVNGLVIDKTAASWPASIAATGLALACYPVGVHPDDRKPPHRLAVAVDAPLPAHRHRLDASRLQGRLARKASAALQGT